MTEDEAITVTLCLAAGSDPYVIRPQVERLEQAAAVGGEEHQAIGGSRRPKPVVGSELVDGGARNVESRRQLTLDVIDKPGALVT